MAEAYRESHPDLPLTVLRQPRNLGYGGNQKSGYRYAADHGWDVVVMLHGDGQYAPEALADMVAPIVDGRGRRRLRLPDDGRAPAPSGAGCPCTSSPATGS